MSREEPSHNLILTSQDSKQRTQPSPLGLLTHRTVSYSVHVDLIVKFAIICYTAIENEYSPVYHTQSTQMPIIHGACGAHTLRAPSPPFNPFSPIGAPQGLRGAPHLRFPHQPWCSGEMCKYRTYHKGTPLAMTMMKWLSPPPISRWKVLPVLHDGPNPTSSRAL